MKRLKILIAIVILPLALLSQENKFEYSPKVKNRVEIKNLLGKITLKNSTSNSVVIESGFNFEKPERAEGLMPLGAEEDNSGLGVNVSEKEGVVIISGVTRRVREYDYTISIPQGIAVSIDYYSPFIAGDLEIDSYKGVLEIITLSAGVKLTNCSGPLTVSSVSGSIEAVFNELSQDEPTSLASTSGLVDVTLPSQTKANIYLSNLTGDVYNNLNLESKSDKKQDKRSEGLAAIGHRTDKEFKLNGGGQKLLIKTVSGNIYLRKK